jgi:hypothetical protein
MNAEFTEKEVVSKWRQTIFSDDRMQNVTQSEASDWN